jgi:hypothetical protein
MNDNIIKFPIELEHSSEHKQFHDQLVKILCDFNDIFIKDSTIPKLDQFNVDWNRISIGLLLQWFIKEAQNISHSHE